VCGLVQSRRIAAAGVAAMLLIGSAAFAAPITTKEGVLPPGSDLGETVADQPTELFATELAGGKRSYMQKLGDMLFSSPAILGGVARQAGISCATCHQQGAGNAALFIPGLSSRPGTFDTTGALFNAKADNGLFDPVTPPSLRGAKFLAPYGHDGRFASLRDFIRNVVVSEFAGPEPSGEVLDALVAYVQDIAFLPNPKLNSDGKLTDAASEAAHRGEHIFNRPFPHDAATSCASCHQPSSAFVDHQVHDVGSGGFFKTKTLINAKFNAPYFHDGRFDSYDQVVGYFDKHFDLGLNAAERADLVAYLDAVGDATEPTTPDTVQSELDEIRVFVSVLDTAIRERNAAVIAVAVDTVGGEWRELGEHIPEAKDTSVEGGLRERVKARGAVREMVLALRQIDMAAARGDFDAAAEAYADYRSQVAPAATALVAAEPWSLFNVAVRRQHLAALGRLADLAK
jgi:cytochrome c peroxidase